MKTKNIISLFLTLFVGLASSYAQNKPLPYLAKNKSGVVQFYVDNKPFIMLSGELHNSSCGSAYSMRDMWSVMAKKNLNTVIAPVSWELIEPQEGVFDYSLVDSMIYGARKENLKLVVIWFGSWKNGKSSYVPEWVKTDTKRFPLVQDKTGKKLPILSTLSQNSLNADAHAFAKLMKHIRKIDEKEQTVIMVQVQNEIGILGSDRDYSDVGNKAFNEEVPAELIKYIQKHKDNLYPELKNVWEANGYKTNGTWEEVFGQGVEKEWGSDWQISFSKYTEELFMAWNYAKYVGEISKKGKEQYPLPMFANAWLRQKKGPIPGQFPSGGPLPEVLDIWRAAAPSIDFIAPDIYTVRIFDWVCSEFKRSDNPLFIPETSLGAASAARALLAIGEYDAIGYSPFNIDGGGMFTIGDVNDESLSQVYNCLQSIMPLITKYAGTDNMSGIYLDKKKEDAQLDIGDYVINVKRNSIRNSFDITGVDIEMEVVKDNGEIGLIVIKLQNDEFIVAGGVGGVSISISKSEKNKWENIAFTSVDEIMSENGKVINHRLNGDETASGGIIIKPGEVKVFKIKMYGY
ncbi:DUF5597 domain-containing protein [Plebeiibacterium marinum]|uniref:DUF5597 domain-containing protein n=1 Tax=Plebeiibacterium marinum TaxID=2992111 RepID=A0AAE3MGD5_9BACT|nr:DUF5597 domain-containing protein [Plebeiobacterium marinum]MCW3807045.1 DUF5597 domain-containing protein [Plebeiobacterium marinum]